MSASFTTRSFHRTTGDCVQDDRFREKRPSVHLGKNPHGGTVTTADRTRGGGSVWHGQHTPGGRRGRGPAGCRTAPPRGPAGRGPHRRARGGAPAVRRRPGGCGGGPAGTATAAPGNAVAMAHPGDGGIGAKKKRRREKWGRKNLAVSAKMTQKYLANFCSANFFFIPLFSAANSPPSVQIATHPPRKRVPRRLRSAMFAGEEKVRTWALSYAVSDVLEVSCVRALRARSWQ